MIEVEISHNIKINGVNLENTNQYNNNNLLLKINIRR